MQSNPIFFAEGWPTVYKYRFFKNGDIVMCKYDGHLGVVLDEAPGSTYPGDVQVGTKEYQFLQGSYECPDNYRLVWRDNEK